MSRLDLLDEWSVSPEGWRFGALLLALVAIGVMAQVLSRRGLRDPNRMRRTASHAAVYAVMFFTFASAPISSVLLVALLGTLVAREILAAFAAECARRTRSWARRSALGLAFVTPGILAFAPPELAAPALVGCAVLVGCVGAMALPHRRPLAALATALALAGLNAFVLLRLRPAGDVLCLFAFFTINIADSTAYLCGRAFGRRPLAPNVSPNKTIEGAVGSFVLTVPIALFLAWALSLPLTPGATWGAAISLTLLAQVGDLLQSALKRRLGIKDFGALLPGHGGVLDRFDSSVLAVPVFLLVFTP